MLALLGACGGGSKPALQSIEVDAISLAAAVGTTAQVRATGIYADHSHQDFTSQVTWSSSNTALATISTTGAVAAVAPGSVTLSATLQGLTGTVAFSVTPAVLVSIGLTPAAPKIPVGTTRQLTATGVFSDGTTQDLTAQASWQTSVPAVASVGTAGGSPGLVTALSNGATTLSATALGVVGATAVTVSGGSLTAIEVTPAAPSIAKGATQQLTATGVFSDQSTADLTSQVAWSSSNPTVAAVTSGGTGAGLISTLALGTSTITATLASVQGSASVTVTAATIASIQVTPATPSAAKGLTVQLTATGTYTDGSTHDVTKDVTWSTSSPSVATVSNATGANGLVTAAGIGTATMTATLGTVSGNVVFSVTQALLQSITVAPSKVSIAAGLTQQLTATGTYTDGTTQDLTTAVTWTSAADSVVSVSNATGTKGLATAVGTAGSASDVFIALNGLTSTGNVTIVGLSSITVSPAKASVLVGQTQAFTAAGTYSDGSTHDLTNQVTWTSASNAIVTISNAAGTKGIATAVGTAGSGSNLSATLTGITGTANVTVVGLVSIAVTPANTNVYIGTPLQLTATGTYSDGSTADITTQVTWSSAGDSIATVSNAAGSQGVVTAVGTPGSGSNIYANLDGITGTGNVIVVGSVAVLINPLQVALSMGYSQQFNATSVYSDGSVQDITNAVDWSSGNENVLTLSNAAGSKGLASVVGEGSASVSGTPKSYTELQFNGTAYVAARTADRSLISISITPLTASVSAGRTLQLKASGYYTDGGLYDITDLVTWSLYTSAASISNADGSRGVLTAGPTANSFTFVQATLGNVASVGYVYVTPATQLQSAVFTPASPSIANGLTQQLTATGTYADGTTGDLTASLTWSSTNTAVATVSASGNVSAVGPGTASIQAKQGTALLGTVPVTVYESFAKGTSVYSILGSSCGSSACHAVGTSSAGITLGFYSANVESTYAELTTGTDPLNSQSFLSEMAASNAAVLCGTAANMPLTGDKLTSAQCAAIQSWLNAGHPDN